MKGEIEKDYSNLDSFVIYMCVGGDGQVSVNDNSEKIRQGETLLIPAENKNVQLSAKNCELLEVYIK